VQPYNQILSNVPGPPPLYVLGARLLELYPMPPLFERQGFGTAVMSYDGRLCWCILADRDGVPDLGALPMTSTRPSTSSAARRVGAG
jgi:diacylglycerol O-acyltransferase / wax synthase